MKKNKDILEQLDLNLQNSNYCFFQSPPTEDDKLYEPIMIYQMGKVASETIRISLEKAGFKNIFKPHTQRIESILDNLAKGINTPDSKFILNTYYAIKNSILKKSKIITIVRNPIEKAISNFFYMHKKISGEEIDSTIELEELKKIFDRSYEIVNAVIWYDIEFKSTTGVDLLEQAFDFDKGYSIYNINGFDILVLKVETTDLTKEKAIKEFLKIDNFEIVRSNESKSKPYSEIYKRFNKFYKVDDFTLNKIFSTRYVRAFYSKNEIDKIKEKWTSGKRFSTSHFINNLVRRKRF